MKFSIQLSADYPDKAYGGDRVYGDMLSQATLADRLGFDSVTITEHHFMNCLMMPAPLQFAVKIAAHTEQLKIITAIAILPIRDMRIFAGEVVLADIFPEGRLLLGVGRGNFEYEIERLGIPMSETRERFEESLDVLKALLEREVQQHHRLFVEFGLGLAQHRRRQLQRLEPPLEIAQLRGDRAAHLVVVHREIDEQLELAERGLLPALDARERAAGCIRIEALLGEPRRRGGAVPAVGAHAARARGDGPRDELRRRPAVGPGPRRLRRQERDARLLCRHL